MQVTEDSDVDSDDDSAVKDADSMTSTYSATVSCAMPAIDLPASALETLTDCAL